MCTFNTLLLPAPVHVDVVNVVAHAVLRQTFVRQGNAAIERAVGAPAHSYIKDKSCDCGMGLAERPPGVDEQATDREIRKLRASGWGEAKIERWRVQRDATRQKHAIEGQRAQHAHRATAAQWAAFVRRILDERISPWVGLFTHDYRGSTTTERIEISDVRRQQRATTDELARIEEDVLFVFSDR